MDGDNTHNPGLILKMVRLIREGNDVVIASRYHKGGTVVGYGLIKRIISRIGNIIYRVVLPIRRVKDYTSGFRAYRGSTLLRLHKIYGDKIIERKDFTSVVEILVKLRRLKSVFFQEISFIYRYDKKEEPSKMNLKTNTVAHLLLVMDIINNRFRTLKKGLD
jgi:dolichol-phosphate mannosyltransferase